MGVSNKLDRNNIEDILALTPTQEGMLFHYINQPHSEMYFEQLSVTLTGEVNIDLLKKAWAIVIGSNEMLRTVYRWDNVDKPIQIVLKEFEPLIKEYDLSNIMNASRKSDILKDLREEDRREKLDITDKPYRILLCKLSSNEVEMVISNHHILFDGWSTMLILKELLHTYRQLFIGEIPSPQVKNKFKEYIKWIKRQDKDAQKAFWNEYLTNLSEKTLLPYDEGLKSDESGIKTFLLKMPSEVSRQILDFSAQNQLTAAAVFYCAWGVLLQKYSIGQDSVFGTTVSGRTPEIKGVENIAGLFINTIPLRVKTEENETLMDTLRRVDKDLIRRQEYEASSLIDIKNYIDFDRKQNLFDSIMVIENYPLDKSLKGEEGIIKVESFSIFEMTNYALTLGITYYEEVVVNFIYDCALFSEDTIGKISKAFESILLTIVSKPNERVSEIDILSEEEKLNITRRIKAKETEDKEPTETYEYQEPENEIEISLAEIWKKVLGVERIGTRDNFFDIGGNSILLIQVHAKIEKLYPGVITGTDLFTYPTISKLARYIESKTNCSNNNLQLEVLGLPEDYFLQGSEEAGTGVLRFSFEGELFERIKAVAHKEASSVHIFFLSMFAYLFTEVSGNKDITVQTLVGPDDLALPININIDGLDGFSTLFKVIGDGLKSKDNTYKVCEVAQQGLKKDENSIIPLFLNTKDLERVIPLREVYEVIFEMQEESHTVNFICQYNSKRLKKDKIKELVDGYCEIIETLTDQYITN